MGFAVWTWSVLLPRDFVCVQGRAVPSRLRESQPDGSCEVPAGAGRQRSVYQHGLDVRVQPGLQKRDSLPRLLRADGVPVHVVSGAASEGHHLTRGPCGCAPRSPLPPPSHSSAILPPERVLRGQLSSASCCAGSEDSSRVLDSFSHGCSECLVILACS